MVIQSPLSPTDEEMLVGVTEDNPAVLEPENNDRISSIISRLSYGVIVPAILIFESVVTILINARNPDLKKRCSTTFVNNLAVSGIFVGVTSFVVTLLVIDSFKNADLSCKLEILPFYWTMIYFHLVSVTSLLCLSLDRYLAICWPLRYRELMTDTRCRYLAAACWSLSLLCLVIPTLARYVLLVASKDGSRDGFRRVSDAYSIMNSPVARDCQIRENRTSREMELWLTCRRTFTVSYGVSYFFSLFLILCMYGLVMREFCLLKHRAHATTSMKEEDQRVRMKSTRDLILVATLYLTLSLPHVILKVTTVEWTPVDYLKRTHRVTIFLAVIHQILFLPLYAWRFPEFRKELYSKKFWKSCVWPCSRELEEQSAKSLRPSKASTSPSTATSQTSCV